MNLIVDVGNTLHKFAIFDGEVLVEKFACKKEKVIPHIEKLSKDHLQIDACIVSSVGSLPKDALVLLKQLYKVHILSHQSTIPFENHYKTPTTLGVDRIALIAAAAVKFPKQHVLVIDAGSAITYDFLTTENYYLGGAIAPGIAMRYKALNSFTANLPLLEKTSNFSLIGNTTQSAMHSGVLQGVILELEGAINEYKRQYAEITIILTGGDAHFLRDRLKNDIFANSNFLLEGLNYILEHNKD